jgi:hypothetical protein
MTIVLDLTQARIRKQKIIPESLNDFLKRATKLVDEISTRQNYDLIAVVKNSDELKRRIEGVIAEKIIKTRKVSKGLFLCGIYVSQVFTEYLSSSPESWIAVDYIPEAKKLESAFLFKKGGDVCFLICSIFPGRANWRTMNKDYYQKMGETFYHQFYTKTNQEIGYYMSDNFEIMVDITKECVPLI